MDLFRSSGVWSTGAVTFVGKLDIDLPHDIPNGITVRLDFQMNDDKFALVGEKAKPSSPNLALNYQISDMVLQVPVAELEDSVYLKMEKNLETSPMILPYTRKEIVINTIPAMNRHFISDPLFSNELTLPSKIAVAFVKSSAFAGSFSENPLEFLNTVTDGGNSATILSQGLYINGVPIEGVTSEDPKLDFFRMNLYSNFVDTGFCNSIDFSAFLNGFYLTVFDLTTAAGSAPTQIQVPGVRSGHCRYVL